MASFGFNKALDFYKVFLWKCPASGGYRQFSNLFIKLRYELFCAYVCFTSQSKSSAHLAPFVT